MKLIALLSEVKDLFFGAEACDRPRETFENCKTCRKEFCKLRKEKPRDTVRKEFWR